MDPSEYEGRWKVNRGELFPAGTIIVIRQDGTESFKLSITEPEKEPQIWPASFDAARDTVDFHGPGELQFYQISLFNHPLTKYKCIYGIQVIGDPEDAGVFGAEDDELPAGSPGE